MIDPKKSTALKRDAACAELVGTPAHGGGPHVA